MTNKCTVLECIISYNWVPGNEDNIQVKIPMLVIVDGIVILSNKTFGSGVKLPSVIVNI